MAVRTLVTGAGGFIGHHVVCRLKSEGHWVRGVDLKHPEYAPSSADEFVLADLRLRDECRRVASDVDEVYHFAADMGGIGYISHNHAEIATNNVLIDAHMLAAAAESGAERYFYASSACVYPLPLQVSADVSPLREDTAWPAEPEEGYGLEKLYGEKLCEYYGREAVLETRVARFHNIYGPLGTFSGGREKAPAAICRKVASVRESDEIAVWGDGKQTRSFLYIDDCVEGILRLMRSEYREPLNIGTDELTTIDQLVSLVAEIAGKEISIRHDRSRPQGVRGRNSDMTNMKAALGWTPQIPLREGLTTTYRWIAQELAGQSVTAARRS